MVIWLRLLITMGISGELVWEMLRSAWRIASRKFSFSTRLASTNRSGVPRRSAPPDIWTLPPPDNGALPTLVSGVLSLKYFASSSS